MELRRLCVFCSSSNRLPEPFREEARALGARMAEEGIELVYGGGSVGLMGVLADAVLAGGGKATGVIPDFLSTKELAHEGLTRMLVTRSMHDRKREMSRLAAAFAVLPGWFDPLMEYCRRAEALGAVSKGNLGLFTVVDRADEAVDALLRMRREAKEAKRLARG